MTIRTTALTQWGTTTLGLGSSTAAALPTVLITLVNMTMPMLSKQFARFSKWDNPAWQRIHMVGGYYFGRTVVIVFFALSYYQVLPPLPPPLPTPPRASTPPLPTPPRAYTPPFPVFTQLASADRGRCCGSGCRHCDHGHENVPAARRATLPPPIVVAGIGGAAVTMATATAAVAGAS